MKKKKNELLDTGRYTNIKIGDLSAYVARESAE